MSNSQKGFAPVLLLVLVLAAGLVTVPILGKSVTTSNPNSPSVQGVLIAKGGDDGGRGSSGGSDSSDGSHDSGGPSNNNSDSSGGSSEKSGKVEKFEKPQKVETKIKIEKPKIENEVEIENEIEDEVEKLEVERVEIKSSAGGQLEVETKNASSSGLSRGKRGSATQLSFNKSGLKIKVKNNEIEFESKGVAVQTNFPLFFNNTTNTLFVNTPNGPKPIRILPDRVSETAKNSGLQTLIEKIDLEQTATGSAEPLEFKIKGKRTGNLFGLIPVSADVETKVGAQTGEILSVTQPNWLRLLNSFIR